MDGPITSLFVTYADVEAPFFVIYGQTDKKSVENVTACIKSYSGHFDSGIGSVTDPQQQLSAGMLCVGKYIDNIYYRVKVVSVDHKSHLVQGFFIDFGNKATIKVSDLRLVSLPKESNFLHVKPLCTKYVIANTVLVVGMEEKALQWIRPYVISEETSIKMVEPNINAIELYFNANGKSYSISSSLVHKGYGTTVRPEEQFYLYQNVIERKIPSSQLSQPPPPTSILKNPTTAAQRGLGSLGGVQGYGPPPTVESSLRPILKAPTVTSSPLRGGLVQPKPQSDALLQNQEYQVIVAYVDEEDMTIVVHKKEDADTELGRLLDNINSYPVQPYQSILEPGAYVLARQTPQDPLCRAVIVRIKDAEDQAQAYFIDFGHKAYLPMSEIFQLPEQFATQKGMAHRCHLANLELAGPWTKEVRQELEAIVSNRILRMKILTSPMKTKRTVTLSFVEDNRSVVDVLVQQLKPLMFESVHIPKGQTAEVVISHALNAARFFVQLTSNQAALDALMEEVQTYAEQELAGKPVQPAPFSETELINGNLPCVALFPDDGRWYRAIISDYEPQGKSITVRYVDYGNEGVVTTSDILPIPRHLMKARTQAVECSLSGHSSRRQTDMEETQFEALLEKHDYTFLMSIKMHLVGSVLLVELWERDTKSSVRNLLEAMLVAAQKAKAASPPLKPVLSSPKTSASSVSPSHHSAQQKDFGSLRGTSEDRAAVTSQAASHRPMLEKQRRQYSSDESGGESQHQRRKPTRDGGSGGDRSGPGGFPPSRQASGGFGGSEREGRGGAPPRREHNDRPSGNANPLYRDSADQDSSNEPRKGGRGGDRADAGDSRPARNPRYGDENEKPGGGGGRFNREPSSGDDRAKSFGGENKFRSAGGGGGGGGGWKGGRDENKAGGGDSWKSRDGGADAGRDSWRSKGGESGGARASGGDSWTKKPRGEDFTSDSWGGGSGGKSFNAKSNSFPSAATSEPKKPPQLLDPYPAGGRVPTLPALGALAESAPRLVSVTHYESPLSFYVQLQDSHDSFLEFMKGLQSDYIKRRPIPRSDLQVGMHVMAQFTEDKALYRAEILQTSPEIKVRFFDYGNESSAPESKVWFIGPTHTSLPMQSIPCGLSNVQLSVQGDDATTLQCVPFFTEDAYQMSIRGYDESNKAQVDLASVESGVQVSARLVEAGLCKLVSRGVSVEDPVDLSLLPSQSVAVHISYVDSTGRFFVHLEPDKPDLITAKVAELLAKPDELFPLTPEEAVLGKFVLATPDFESWYRARLDAKTESDPVNYSVQFIDYGDAADVPIENLRDLPESLTSWCVQAFECRLLSAAGAGDTPLDETLENEFAETYNDVDASIVVTSVDENNRLSVLLYSDKGEFESKFHPSLPPSTPTPSPTIPLLLPYPVLRQGDKVIVSHATASQIFVQKVSNEASLAAFVETAFVGDLDGYYSTSTSLPALSEPSLGQIVAAKSVAFGTWYRARVEALEPELSVHYVDYGNSEVVPKDNLRALDPTHYYPPAFCLPGKLPVSFLGEHSHAVLLDNEEEFTIEYARPPLDGATNTESVTSAPSEWLVNLIATSGESAALAEQYVLKGMASPLENSPFVKELPVLNRWLSQGTTPVTVMSYDSPTDLAISLESDADAQEALQTRLQAFARDTLPILGECDELCLGKYTEDDAWYRARVLDAEFRALFVDYGNADIVPEIRKLSYPLRSVPELSVKCTLPVAPVEGEAWSAAAIERLEALVTDQTPQGKLLDVETGPLPSVELTLSDGTEVGTVLVNEGLAKRLGHKVVISHVNSVTDFFVQYVENEPLDLVFKVMETLEVNAPLGVESVAVGDKLVAAKFPEDEAWYRAKIVSKEAETEEGVTVLFVDFGNTAQVSEFRSLPSNVARLPPLAKQCSLGASPPPDEGEEGQWPETAQEKLNEISNGGEAEFTLTWLNRTERHVTLTTSDGMNVQDILLEPPPLKNYILSHINTANDFYIQDSEDPTIGTITDLMAALESVAPLSQVSPGELVGAKFIDDSAWYRARVLSQEGGTTNVLFVDYGNTSAASWTPPCSARWTFRPLDATLAAYPPCALHCKLSPATPETDPAKAYSSAATARFVELSQGGETLYTADFEEEGEMRTADLYIGEDRVADLLAGLEESSSESTSATNDPSATATPTTTTTGETQRGESTPAAHVPTGHASSAVSRATLVWVNSADDFYITSEASQDTLDAVADQLANAGEWPVLDSVKAGDLVVAQFTDDEAWYRSRVLQDSATGSYPVHFIDYGNASVATAFRAVPAGLTEAKIPALARHVKLTRPEGVHAWPDSATDALNEYVDQVEVEILCDGDPATVELIVDGKRLSTAVAGGAVETSDAAHDASKETKPKPSSPTKESTNVPKPKTSPEPSSPAKEATAADSTSSTAEVEEESELSETISCSPKESLIKAAESAATTETIRSVVKPPSSSEVASETLTDAPTSPSKTSSLKEKVRASEKTKVHLITHVNSPDDFYLMTDAEGSIQIGRLLSKAGEDFEKVHSVLVGGMYAVFNEREDAWYRAQLISLEDDDSSGSGLDMYCVKYVDLGNTDLVTKDGLRELPDSIREMPTVVKNCALETPGGDEDCVVWCDKAVDKLTELLVMGQFLIERMSEGDPARVVLKTTDGINVNEMLLEINAKAGGEGPSAGGADQKSPDDTLNDTIISEAPAKDLTNQRVIISHYGSDAEFAVQVVKDVNILVSINSLLDELKDVDSVEAGQIYAGKTPEGWFRVLVTEESKESAATEEGVYKVHRIDYGDTTQCAAFKTLNEDLSHIGRLAHEVGWKSGAEGAASDLLKQWAENKTEVTVVSVDETEDGKRCVVLKQDDGNDSTTATDQCNGSEETKQDDEKPPVEATTNGEAASPELKIKQESSDQSSSSPSTEKTTPTPTKPAPTSGEDDVKSPVNGHNTSLDETFTTCVGDETIVGSTGEADQEVYIVAQGSIQEFYIQTESDTATLEEISTALAEVGDKTHPRVTSGEVKQGEVYVCQFDDDRLWYRARILSKVSELWRVLFIDYGNVSMASEVRQCPDDISVEIIPPQAKCCEFSNPAAEGGYDLSPSGPLGKAFKTFDFSSVDLRLKSLVLSRSGDDDKYSVEIVVSESGQNLLTYLTNQNEDVDK
uniref:Maternal protein tudor n=1 Tax=Cacopsylla melanoneura TaxID=428564 RepID=A0A8D8Q1V8_9HEMI